MTFWTTKQFKALQKDWYERLEASGFQDAEEIVAGELVLRQKAEHVYNGLNSLQVESKRAYFDFIGKMVQETVFKREVDRLILSMHAEGTQINQICERLAEKGEKRGRLAVRYLIRVYEMRWGLRSYTSKQLNYLKL